MDNEFVLKEIADFFSQFEEVESVVFSGSTTAGSSDEFSDRDIYVYAHKEPDIVKRLEFAQKYSDEFEINNQQFGTGDELTLRDSGLGIDINYRSVQWIEEQIARVWDNYGISIGYTTAFVFNVNKSIILYDKNGWFKKLQEKTQAPYPEKLAENIIKNNLPLLKDKNNASFYEQTELALKRNDMVSVNHRTAAFLASYFDVLFAVNRLLHPGEKRLIQFALQHCKLLPNNFESDVNLLATCLPDYKLKIMSRMNDEVKKIIAK